MFLRLKKTKSICLNKFSNNLKLCAKFKTSSVKSDIIIKTNLYLSS